jgi:V/A-type H+-transporting ATPase subunit A
VGQGVPLRSVLDTGVGPKLLRLTQVTPDEMPRAGEVLRTEMGEALARLEAE